MPAEGLTLADKQAVNKALLASGADIGQMNVVRKHLSAIKGGRLAAAAHPAKVREPADLRRARRRSRRRSLRGRPWPIPSTFADARAMLARYGIEPPPAVRAHLGRAPREETPKPGDPRLAGTETIMIARPQASLEAAAGDREGKPATRP